MLAELRELRDAGYPLNFLNRYAEYRHRYTMLPLSERCLYDFDYFLRMQYIEYLRNDKHIGMFDVIECQQAVAVCNEFMDKNIKV